MWWSLLFFQLKHARRIPEIFTVVNLIKHTDILRDIFALIVLKP